MLRFAGRMHVYNTLIGTPTRALALQVVIAKIDATSNDLPKAINVRGFPTLMLFRGDGTAPEQYEVRVCAEIAFALAELVRLRIGGRERVGDRAGARKRK